MFAELAYAIRQEVEYQKAAWAGSLKMSRCDWYCQYGDGAR